MPQYTPHEVDRLYRSLPTAYDDAMLAHPTYSDTPMVRRPPDEMPERIAWMMTLWMALEQLTVSQRLIFKAVVVGLVRVWDGRAWIDRPWQPMTYRQCADYLDLSEKAVGEHLRRARVSLAKRISDETDDDEGVGA